MPLRFLDRSHKDAPVRRIKVEPQLFVNGDWVIYPMEIAVREQVVRRSRRRARAASFRSPWETLGVFLSHGERERLQPSASAEVNAIEALHLRNARRTWRSPQCSADRDELRKRMSSCDATRSPTPSFTCVCAITSSRRCR